jgi:hypothetical protein
MHPLSGTSTNPIGGGNSDNPWVNPLTLAQQDGSNTRYLGPGGQSSNASSTPGQGLWSFLGSGAPQAFQSGSTALQGPTPNGPSLDTVANGSGGLYSPADKIGAALGAGGGAFGKPGSFMNVLSGGAPKEGSAVAGLGKLLGGLFGGGGGF